MSGSARHILALALALGFAAPAITGCGGDSTGPGNGGPGNGDWGWIRATIDGHAWEGDASYLEQVQGVRQQRSGAFPVRGSRLAGTTVTAVLLELTNIPGPGTYPLGTVHNVAGGMGSVVESQSGGVGRVWNTPVNGVAGTVTITTLTATRIAGTFAFTATAASGGATGTRVVTGGAFDIPVTAQAEFPPYPASAVSTASALIGGAPWQAGSINKNISADRLQFSLVNTIHSITFVVEDYDGPGTYPLVFSPMRRIMVTPGLESGHACCWGGSFTTVGLGDFVLDDVGTITVASHTADRIQGTFGGTLAPVSGPGPAPNGPLVLTGGQFSIGLGQAP